MAQQPMKAKLNYKPKSSIEVFYSGGAISLSKTGLLACACQNDIKVSMATFCSVNLCRHPCQQSGPSQALVNSTGLWVAADRGHPQWGCYPDSVRGELRTCHLWLEFHLALMHTRL